MGMLNYDIRNKIDYLLPILYILNQNIIKLAINLAFLYEYRYLCPIIIAESHFKENANQNCKVMKLADMPPCLGGGEQRNKIRAIETNRLLEVRVLLLQQF